MPSTDRKYNRQSPSIAAVGPSGKRRFPKWGDPSWQRPGQHEINVDRVKTTTVLPLESSRLHTQSQARSRQHAGQSCYGRITSPAECSV